MARILALDPTTYRRHLIHGEGRKWAETNCYSDLLIEQIHALGHEPIAALPFTLGIDFEGDQWTFFKFPAADLMDLYGLDVQELAVWKPLHQHLVEQLSLGRPVLAELDSFYLPDTAGTAYKLARVKTTVSVNEIDVSARKLGYFHNQGYFELGGNDFDEILQIAGTPHERVLPPYVEFVKRERERHLPPGDLVEASLAILRKHLALAPKKNPFVAFKSRFEADLEWLMKEEIDRFHAYSFATLRQYGACYELTETYFRWLEARTGRSYSAIANAFGQISETAKTFQFQLARAMARRRPLELSPIDAMAAHWNEGMEGLSSHREAL